MSNHTDDRGEQLLDAISRLSISTTPTDFDSLVELAEQKLSLHIEGGLFTNPDRSLGLVTHIYAAGVGVWYPLRKGVPSGISTDGAWALVASSDRDPIAFDLAAKIAAHDLSLTSRCKKPLAQFAAKLLRGEIDRPRQRGRSPAAKWARDFWICATIEDLVNAGEGRFAATRNDASDSKSCCDAVVHALGNLGIPMSYDSVKMIWRRGNQRGGAGNFLRDMRHLGAAARGYPFLFRWHVGTK